MGSTTGHMTMAMRDPMTGALYVHESQAKSSYWPTNGTTTKAPAPHLLHFLPSQAVQNARRL